jgi:hypothetical protein
MKRKQQQAKAPQEGPSDDFCEWWNASGIDKESGAAVGGHPDASRTWARKDAGRWTRRTYGISAVHAWAADCYRQEYLIWVATGRPERPEPFVSLALPVAEQSKRWREVNAKLAAMPKVKTARQERQEEQQRQRKIQQQKVAMHQQPKALPAPQHKDNNNEDESIPF